MLCWALENFFRARIAGGSAVAKDIPAGETWSGAPAKLSRQHFKEIATLSKLAKQGKRMSEQEKSTPEEVQEHLSDLMKLQSLFHTATHSYW